MMIKALAALTLILVAVDYAITGGNYSSTLVRGVAHFFGWLAAAGRNSLFSW